MSGVPPLKKPRQPASDLEMRSIGQTEKSTVEQRVSFVGQSHVFPYNLLHKAKQSILSGWRLISSGFMGLLQRAGLMAPPLVHVTLQEIYDARDITLQMKERLISEWDSLSENLVLGSTDRGSLESARAFFNKVGVIKNQFSISLPILEAKINSKFQAFAARSANLNVAQLADFFILRNAAGALLTAPPVLRCHLAPSSLPSIQAFQTRPYPETLKGLQRLAVQYITNPSEGVRRQYEQAIQILHDRCFNAERQHLVPIEAEDGVAILEGLSEHMHLVQGCPLEEQAQKLRRDLIAAECSTDVSKLNRRIADIQRSLTSYSTAKDLQRLLSSQEVCEAIKLREAFIESGYPAENIIDIGRILDAHIKRIFIEKKERLLGQLGPITHDRELAGQIEELWRLAALCTDSCHKDLSSVLQNVIARATCFRDLDTKPSLEEICKRLKALQVLRTSIPVDANIPRHLQEDFAMHAAELAEQTLQIQEEILQHISRNDVADLAAIDRRPFAQPLTSQLFENVVLLRPLAILELDQASRKMVSDIVHRPIDLEARALLRLQESLRQRTDHATRDAQLDTDLLRATIDEEGRQIRDLEGRIRQMEQKQIELATRKSAWMQTQVSLEERQQSLSEEQGRLLLDLDSLKETTPKPSSRLGKLADKLRRKKPEQGGLDSQLALERNQEQMDLVSVEIERLRNESGQIKALEQRYASLERELVQLRQQKQALEQDYQQKNLQLTVRNVEQDIEEKTLEHARAFALVYFHNRDLNMDQVPIAVVKKELLKYYKNLQLPVEQSTIDRIANQVEAELRAIFT